MAYIGPAPANSIIATSDIEDDAITTAKIIDDAVTSAKTSFTTGTFSSDVTGLTVNSTGDTSAGDNAAVGYTAAEGLILTGQGSTDDITVKNDADTTILNVATGGTDVEVSAGNIFFGTADKGIYLGVTSATAANLLDDYEEGTFTANYTFGGSTTGLTYNSIGQAGRYIKVGNLCFVYIYVGLTDKGSDAGAIKIVGLPFTTKANSGQNLSALITIGYGTGGWDLTADHIITGGIGENSVIISLMQGRYDTDTNPTNLTGAMATDDSQIYASMTYETA